MRVYHQHKYHLISLNMKIIYTYTQLNPVTILCLSNIICHDFFFIFYDLREDCLFCWYWWNCCPSLFKFSFHKFTYEKFPSLYRLNACRTRVITAITGLTTQNCNVAYKKKLNFNNMKLCHLQNLAKIWK